MRFFFAGCIAFAGCRGEQTVAPPPDQYAAACANLAHLGCPEGTSAQCAQVMSNAAGALHIAVDAGCIAAAKTQAGVRSCGFVRCSGDAEAAE
jgi:hypothetical protein